ncbi:MAG: PPC domain-containing protein [Acidobacteriota bacterium]
MKISRPQNEEKISSRTSPVIDLDKASAFRRLQRHSQPESKLESGSSPSREMNKTRIFNPVRKAAGVPDLNKITPQSFGTGGGDINEIEPNDVIAQGVSLPVNIFGRMAVDGDIDFFAFEGLAGQSHVIEAFASRLQRSDMIADLLLFNSSGQLLARDIGDVSNDPLIRFTPAEDAVFIIGIADVDDFGGASYNYLLNITRGVDVNEVEPNDRQAQSVSSIPTTIFGDIEVRNDVDFYSFIAEAGETLIVDVDAEVLGSRLDPEINLSDPQTGVEYFYNDEYDGADSRFNIVLPYTGRYVIGIGAFQSNSTGFYRLNISTVAKTGAPTIFSVTRAAKKVIEIVGTGFTNNVIVEVNSVRRKITFIGTGIIRAKVKARSGDVVTIRSSIDDRRSNPLIVQ